MSNRCQTTSWLTFSAWHDRKRYQRNIWQDLEIFWLSSNCQTNVMSNHHRLIGDCASSSPWNLELLKFFFVSFDWGITPQVPHWNLNHGNISLGSTPSVPQEIWIGSAKGFVGSCHWLGDYSFSSPLREITIHWLYELHSPNQNIYCMPKYLKGQNALYHPNK